MFTETIDDNAKTKARQKLAQKILATGLLHAQGKGIATYKLGVKEG